MKYVLNKLLRCDSLVDRSQIDKIYYVVIDKSGKENQFFLVAGPVSKREVQEILDAIKIVSISTTGTKATEYVFKNILLIVTGGTYIHTSDRGELWTLLNYLNKNSDH